MAGWLERGEDARRVWQGVWRKCIGGMFVGFLIWMAPAAAEPLQGAATQTQAAQTQTTPPVPFPKVQPTTAGLEKVRVQLKWRHQFQFAGFYAAIAQGFYRAEGLDVELFEAPATESAVPVVLRGGAEFGVHGSDLVVERAHGKPVVALAAILQHSPMVLLTRRDTGIDALHDLAGRKILLGPDAAELLAYLRAENVAGRDLQLGHQSFDVEALINGAVDAMPAYATDEPWLLQQRRIDYNLFSPRAAGIDFYGDTLFTTEAIVKARPDMVKRFLNATRRGWYYALAHRPELVELIRARYGDRHSREHLLFEAEQLRRLMTPDLVEIGHMSEGRWRHIADTYAELAMMPQDYDLAGFLYDPNPKLDMGRLYLWGAGLGLLALWGIVWSVHYRRLNQRLNREMQERQAVEAELRESEQRFRKLLEHAPFPVLITRLDDSRVLYANQRAIDDYGAPEQALIGHPSTEFYVNPEDRQRLVDKLDNSGHARDIEIAIRDMRDQVHWVLVSASLIDYLGAKAVFAALSDISVRKRLESELLQLANTDSLTGCMNRRYFLERLESEVNRCRRYGSALSLLTLDIDHFKQVNDTHGHAAGDAALQAFARALPGGLRDTDFLGRMGGEEFAIVLPETGLEMARQVAERLRVRVEALRIESGSATFQITVSIGLAQLASDDDLRGLMVHADSALYNAKHQGRNRVVAYGE